jgi:hypothetical protein
MTKQGTIDKKKPDGGLIGFRPLTFNERLVLWEKMRTAQGKASEVTMNLILSATGTKDMNPLEEKMKILEQGGKLKKLNRLDTEKMKTLRKPE